MLFRPIDILPPL